MFGIGFWEMLMIAGLILVAVGPERLPGMIKTVARLYRQARRAAMDIRQSTGIDDVLRDDELKELAQLRNQKIQLMGPAPAGKAGLVPKPMVGKPLPGAPAPVGKPGVVEGKPMEGKPMAPEGTMPAGKPGFVDKPFGKPMAPAGGVGGGAMESPEILRGLTLEDRRRELPPDGVDVVCLRHQLAPRDVQDGQAA